MGSLRSAAIARPSGRADAADSTLPISTLPVSTLRPRRSPISTLPTSTLPISTLPISTLAVLDGSALDERHLDVQHRVDHPDDLRAPAVLRRQYGHRYYGRYYDHGCGCDRYASPDYTPTVVVATQVASVPKGGVNTGDGSFQ